MIDTNAYRQRIGTFSQPGQRKFKTNKLSNYRKRNGDFKVNIIQFLLLLSTANYLSSIFNQQDVSSRHEGWKLESNKGNWQSSEPKNLSLSSVFYTKSNWYARYTYGNRNNRGIKLSHWNAGSAHLPQKLNEIESVINRHNPHIFGVSESNLLKKHKIEDVQIPDYELITALTMDNPKLQYSRVVVYKHSSIISKVRKDLMSNEFSSIWLECGLPNKRKFLVCNLYREWQFLGQGPDKSSLDCNNQLSRWLIFIEQFERALDTGMEIYCLGDVNIDFLTWTKTDLNPQHKTVKQKKLIVALFDRILSRGVKQLITTFTHSWPGTEDGGLDHFYTNAPGKISSVQVQHEGHSDHKIIHAIRMAKLIRSNRRYVKKRSYKYFDKNAFIEEIKHTSWWPVYSCEDASGAAQLFTQILGEVLDRHASVKVLIPRPILHPGCQKSLRI